MQLSSSSNGPRLPALLAPVICAASLNAAAAPENYFRVTVIDEETSRGVPLVELRTRHEMRFYTDSNGVAAIGDPGLLNQKVFFRVKSHGYRFEGKFLDETGTVLEVKPGQAATLSVKRVNIAERLYRVTGEGIYHDSLITGQKVPISQPLISGGVTGQDTVLTAVYKGKIHWCWGDTNGLAGFNLSASGATSEIPGKGGLDPSVGVDLTYFVNDEGFSKAMIPFDVRGLKWIEGMTTMTDSAGNERLVGRYASMRGLTEAVAWGLVAFNDEKGEFDELIRWDLHVPHRSAHYFPARVDGTEMIYLYPWLRVRADIETMKDLAAYEAFTCLKPGERFRRDKLPEVERDASGKLVYGWKANTDPVDEYRQRRLIEAGSIKPEEAWYSVHDAVSGAKIHARAGSVFWNEYRRKWVLIAEEPAGQIWYAEGDTITGPWVYARKVVTHDKYSFYNPTQHPFFDQEGGRIIFLEGTYTEAFSGGHEKTPRYDYNQIMYRLALDDPRLALPAPVYRVASEGATELYMMREQVEKAGAWEKILDAPFFALAVDRQRKGSVVVGAGDDGVLAVREADASGAIFRALPPQAESRATTDPLAGKWQCKSALPTGGELAFAMELVSADGKATGTIDLGGASPAKGTFDGKQLQLVIDVGTDAFIITAELARGKLTGDWRRQTSVEKGAFSAERVETPDFQAPSEAETPLYAYRHNSTGAMQYSTDPEMQREGYKRLEQPVCRVWKNPTSVLPLDWKAKHIPASSE
jgi:hypothetical protein